MNRLLCIVIALHLVTGCTVLQTGGPVTDQASLQNQRAERAELALRELEDIDTLIRLNNTWLAGQISTALNSQATSAGNYRFSKLKLNFVRQTIVVDATIEISDEAGNVISASADGDVLLDFSGDRLEWFPRFDPLKITSRNFTFDEGSYAEPIPELTLDTSRAFNTEMADKLVQSGNNTIPLSAVPLGVIEVGASLPGFAEAPAMQSQALRGIFMVAGSAMLIDSSITSIAVDMAFIPDLSTCPADISVSRAEFVENVVSREPEGIIRSPGNTADARYFYSEIRGAKRPMAIIHYWFADGLPVTVEELEVGPSERWRTWSGRGAVSSDAGRLEVLVVEKESGCILAAKTLRTIEPETIVTLVDQAQARQTFKTLDEAFKLETADFSINEDKPVVAQVEVRRPFLRDVLQASLADLNLDAEFDSASLSALQFSADLQAFDLEDMSCESRECPPAPACKIDVTQCKRLRDTRDCASCKFRNPLNNRCVSEAIDPLCEASRSRQNAKYEADRAACIADAEATKMECDQLAGQAASSCQIESEFEDSVCESIKTGMRTIQAGAALASVSTQANATGTLSANFSNLRIEGDLESLKLDMALKSNLKMEGRLKFTPSSAKRPLAGCIGAWSAPFVSRFATAPAVSNLLSNFEESDDSLTANWSGFGMSIDTNPSPLESVFVGNPQLLAACGIGLTVGQVETAISGDNPGFFTGHIELEIQPLPTIIGLNPARIGSGDQVYFAEAKLSARHLRYDIGN